MGLLSTSSSYLTGTPIISCRNFRNNRPCTGFVFTSAHMSLVPLCWIDKSPWATLSVIKKNLFLMCLLFLPADILPFFARRMINLLSWYRRLLSIVYPCASMKYWYHKIIPRTSVILTSSDSVELATFILCFLAMLTMAPIPIDIIALVCPFESQCTPKDPSTNHIMLDRLSAVKYLFMYKVPFRYITPCLSLPQSSLSGCFSLVVKKESSVLISGLALLQRNNNCATVRWNFLAISSLRSSLSSSSRTLNKLSPAGKPWYPL